MDGGCDPAIVGVGVPLRDHGEGRSSQWVGLGEGHLISQLVAKEKQEDSPGRNS